MVVDAASEVVVSVETVTSAAFSFGVKILFVWNVLNASLRNGGFFVFTC